MDDRSFNGFDWVGEDTHTTTGGGACISSENSYICAHFSPTTKKMKKFLAFAAMAAFVVACVPSQAEIEAKEKATQDSIAAAQAVADSMRAAAEAAAAAAAAAAQAAADSAAAAAAPETK